MIEETGRVERIEGDYIWVSPASAGGACVSCKSSANCSSNLLTTLLQRHQTKSVRVENNINAKVNDLIVIGIHPQGLLSGSALIYLLPVFFLFIFAVIGDQFFGEIGSIIIGLAGLILGFLISKSIATSSLMKSRLKLIGLRRAA